MKMTDAAWLDVSDTAVFDAIVNEVARIECMPQKCGLRLSWNAESKLSITMMMRLAYSFKYITVSNAQTGVAFAIVEDPV